MKFYYYKMNQNSLNTYFSNTQGNIRERNHSYFQPSNKNQFNNINIVSNDNNQKHQSEKYKNYYNQYQDYRQPSISQLQLSNNGKMEEITQKKPKFGFQDNVSTNFPFSSTSPSHFFSSHNLSQNQSNLRQNFTSSTQDNKHLERQRFYTSTADTHLNHSSRNQNSFYQNNSNSLVFINNLETSQNNNNKYIQQINPKIDLYNFVNQKLSSRIQSNSQSRQKIQNNKSEYLQKANKKISLKRDIVPNNPKNKQIDKNEVVILQDQFIKNGSVSPKNLSNFGSLSTKNSQFIIQKKKQNFQDHSFPKSFTEGKLKEISFKKNSISAYQLPYNLQQSQFQQIEELKSQKRNKGYNITENIQKNQQKKIMKLATNQIIDSEIFTDMKISRIQQSTNNLQEKIQKIYKNLKLLFHNSKEQQNTINEINSYITKQEEEGITSHDVKRIKKELKIMKTNFETAFTSMTDQINRKLTKQENIMKNLSQEIRAVAEDSQKVSQILSQKSRKFQFLQKSMTSFMRQNQERMENLVLNQSFNSSKRSKNHSFEYGLDLKNMSGQQNINGIRNQNLQIINKKIETIEREIKKMKIFHMEEQDASKSRFQEIRQQFNKFSNENKKSSIQQKYMTQKKVKQFVQEANLIFFQSNVESLNHQINQKYQKSLDFLKKDIENIKSKTQELAKICHQQLYQFRMNKLQSINNPSSFIIQNQNQSNSHKFQEQIFQLAQKHRSLLFILTECQQKIISLQDKQHNTWKNIQDNKIKQLKSIGDMRQLQIFIKDLKQELSQSKNDLNYLQKDQIQVKSVCQRTQNQMRKKSQQLSMHSSTILNIQQKLKQLDRINSIQTQNIESINSQFQRVINKEIIPKFGEIHQVNIEINEKIRNMGQQILVLKKNEGLITGSSMNRLNESKEKMIEKRELQKKIEEYFQKRVEKFMENKVKVVSSRLLSSNDIITAFDIYRKYNDQEIYSQDKIEKQQTYLIDEEGYLMDWQGTYLMEIGQLGTRKKVQISEEQVYFMQLNGVHFMTLPTK